MARFERHGSELAARPNVAWGATTDPEGSCSGGPKLEVQPRPSSESGPGPVAVDAPLRENHADPRVHGALS